MHNNYNYVSPTSKGLCLRMLKWCATALFGCIQLSISVGFDPINALRHDARKRRLCNVCKAIRTPRSCRYLRSLLLVKKKTQLVNTIQMFIPVQLRRDAGKQSYQGEWASSMECPN